MEEGKYCVLFVVVVNDRHTLKLQHAIMYVTVVCLYCN